MNKTIVYSCITGGYDKPEDTILASKAIPELGVSFVLFTDEVKEPETYNAGGTGIEWTKMPLSWGQEARDHGICIRRVARWHKVNSHVLFPDAHSTVWLDGSQRIKPIRISTELVQPSLASHDLATFKHPDRTCVYQELMACKRWKKDNKVLMHNQIAKYRADNYPPFNGLVETACVVRRNCPAISEFNKLWWREIAENSYRDQLSFNYIAWKSNLAYAHIPGSRNTSPFFDFTMHGKR